VGFLRLCSNLLYSNHKVKYVKIGNPTKTMADGSGVPYANSINLVIITQITQLINACIKVFILHEIKGYLNKLITIRGRKMPIGTKP
jgi:hypothetical protein